MSQININNLTFYYDGSYDNIFEDVSIQLDTDWKLGLVGRNGRGKTTLLNLLQNKYEYKGNISTNTLFEYFPFPVEDKHENTIEIVEKIMPNYEFWKICKELSLLQVDADVFYRPFSSLSNGEQTKVMLAILFSGENQFLLIDEPTNHLDMETRGIVKDYLNKKSGFILVSHDRDFLDGCIDHMLVINKCDIQVYQGNFSTWWENKQNQDAFEQSENEKLKKEIKRLNEASKRTKEWSDTIEGSKIGNHVGDRGFVGHKAAKMMKRSKVITTHMQNAAEEKSKLLKNVETAESLRIIPLKHPQNVLVEMDKVSLFYDEKCLFDELSFKVENGERVALQGKNGSGKSSILKKLLGEEINSTGRIKLASGLILSYVSQDTSYLKGNLKQFAINNNLEESLFKAILRKLDFSRVQFEKNLEDFSGGQKKKVLLAKSLCEQGHLYLWDEPLNFIDIFSRMQIEELILKHQLTILMVEHDKTFINKVATKVIEL